MFDSNKENRPALESKDDAGKKHYTKPTLTPLGSIHTLTLGSGGSSMDGNFTTTQRGKGNDGTNPHGGTL